MRFYFLVFAVGIIFGVALVQMYGAFFGNGSMSDEEVYDFIIDEMEFFVKVSGLENKTLVELPVHLNNHKPRIIRKIDGIRPRICNGSISL